MAIIAPFIAEGLLGLTGIAATITEAVIGIGGALGASYLSTKLSPQPATQSYPGMRLFVSYGTNEPRDFAIGKIADAGAFEYHNVYGPNGNDYVQFIYKLSDHPCTSLEGLFVNGVEVTLGSRVSTTWVSGRTVSEYPGSMWVEFHDGAWDQDADADLVARATGAAWSSNNRGRGVCYVRVTMKFDAKLYKSGRPNFLFVYKAAKFYDWRKDTTVGGAGTHRWGDESTYEWSDNVAVAVYNFKRGIYVHGQKLVGMNVPVSSLPLDVWTASANVCDETVFKKDGSTEKRYSINCQIPVDTQNSSVVRDMGTAMAAVMTESGGVFKFYAGAAQDPVLHITDDDLTSLDEVTFAPRQSRGNLVNDVSGSFTDPTQLYKPTPLPTRRSPDDQAADGGIELAKSFGLKYVSSATQGQRILEIIRRRGRYQRNLTLKLSAIGAILESGDWITWTSARYGFDEMQFQVVQATLNRDFTVSVELQETSDSIYAWSAASDELDPLDPHDVGPGSEKFSTVQGVSLETVVVEATGSIQRPGLHIAWTPVTDATVTTLELEYRQVGTLAILKDTILDPTAGQYTWVTGIQSGVEYEARLNLVTAPPRGTVWSAWVSTESTTAPQVVAIAALAEGVPPDTITPAMLDAQSRFELSLTVAVDTIQGGYGDILNRLKAMRENLADAAISAAIAANNANVGLRNEQRIRSDADLSLVEQITTLFANLADAGASIATLQQTVADLNSAFATQITNVQSTLGSNTAAIQQVQTSLNGVITQWAIQTNVNGEITGRVRLDGTGAESVFSILASAFKVSMLGTPGGNPVDVFTIANVNGVARIAFAADMFADGSITARHLNVASISTLYISDPSNTYFWNFATGQDGRTDGTWLMDRKNKTWDIIF